MLQTYVKLWHRDADESEGTVKLFFVVIKCFMFMCKVLLLFIFFVLNGIKRKVI